MSTSKRLEYDLSTREGRQRFINEHVKANEDAWLAQVAKMEGNHQRISFEDTKKYRLLEKLQEPLDRIAKRLQEQ